MKIELPQQKEKKKTSKDNEMKEKVKQIHKFCLFTHPTENLKCIDFGEIWAACMLLLVAVGQWWMQTAVWFYFSTCMAFSQSDK